jgi:hypothetical protein
MHSCTLSVSLMQGFDASMLPQRNARRHERNRWFLLALKGYHRSEARDFFKRSDLAVGFLRYAHHCRTRLRPLYIDLITDKLISAHPVEAAAESQQSYGRDHRQQLQIETSLKHNLTFHVATIGRACARRYGSHVVFCMARFTYFSPRRGPLQNRISNVRP